MTTINPPSYRAVDAAAMAGLTFRQIDYWDRTDLLKPSAQHAEGSGSRRRYSIADILRARALALIAEVFGVSSTRALSLTVLEAKPGDLSGSLKLEAGRRAELVIDLSIDEEAEPELWAAVVAMAVKP